MINYVINNKETVALATAGIALAIVLLIKAAQKIGLEKIRGYVYKLFVAAEKEFQYGENTEKFEYVINLAKAAIPMPFSLFITESLLRKVVQAWFDLVKDLLDDGKLNGTSTVEQEEPIDE